MDITDAFTLYIIEKYGLDAVIEAHRKLWINKIKANSQELLSEAISNKRNDIESLMKALQLDPMWNTVNFKITYEMLSEDRGVITVHRCPEVEIPEALGQEELTEVFCAKLYPEILEDYVRLFNPDIVTKCLVVPSQKNTKDMFCKWEFTYKPK